MKGPYDRELTSEELAGMSDADIDFSDLPELDEAFWKRAQVVETTGPTTPITLRVKTSVLEAFKADGKGYQTRMNAVLEAFVREVKKAG